jgi:hypothetical protein
VKGVFSACAGPCGGRGWKGVSRARALAHATW